MQHADDSTPVSESPETLFRSLLESLPAAAYMCDRDGLITYFNARAAEVWGRRPALNDERDRYCGSQRLFSVDGVPIAHDRCWMALALQHDRSYQAQEIVIERPDGSRINVLAHASPVHVNGEITGAVNILIDFTEKRREHEASLRLSSIVDSSSDAIASKDLNGIVLTWNRAAESMFGYTASEMIGRSITTIIPPERLSEEAEVLGHIRRGEKIDHFETVRRRKDGTPIDISLTVSPIRDDTGRVIGASKIARDITERKRVEALLRESDRRKEEFLAMLAHELRNPLAPIANALQIAQMVREDPKALEHAHGVIQRQLKNLVRLVDDLMDASRITRNKLHLRRERMDLALALRSAVESARSSIESAQQELVIHQPAEPIYVDGDSVRLAQVFSNLLNNAAKYTERGGRITVSVNLEASEVVVRVRDTGIGIPREMCDKIFDMFVQIDGSLERSQGGLGIGLSLVRALVELHGGTVRARSDGAGRGSEFVVRLPTLDGAAPHERRAIADGSAASSGTKQRVLVVDDNEDSAHTLATILTLRGHEVRIANDGVEAVELAIAFAPDIAFMDIGLPRLNGYEVARRLREHPTGKHTFMVAVTGWGHDEDKRRAFEAGFDHHMVKPIDHAQLHALLMRLDRERRMPN